MDYHNALAYGNYPPPTPAAGPPGSPPQGQQIASPPLMPTMGYAPSQCYMVPVQQVNAPCNAMTENYMDGSGYPYFLQPNVPMPMPVSFTMPNSNNVPNGYIPSGMYTQGGTGSFQNSHEPPYGYAPPYGSYGDQEEMTDNPVLTFGPGPPIITNEEVRGPKGSNLFVFHLPNETTNWDLFLLFRKYGDVLSVHIMVNTHTGLSKGYGFISYKNPKHAEAAIQHMNGFRLGKKRLKVERKRDNIDDNEVEKLFDSYSVDNEADHAANGEDHNNNQNEENGENEEHYRTLGGVESLGENGENEPVNEELMGLISVPVGEQSNGAAVANVDKTLTNGSVDK